MARVAFCLACSMSWCNTLGSVFKTFDPAERITFPSLSARANSRCVCRRPCGVVYQSASSASDLNFGASIDVRGIIPPVGSVHFVGSENDDFVQHASSIYGQCIYRLMIGGIRSKTKTVA